jgi:hypothetical protein
MDFNLKRTIDMLNQAVLRQDQRITALENAGAGSALTKTEADALYAPKSIIASLNQLVDTQQQDVSPTLSSTDLSDSASIARRDAANTFTATPQKISTSNPQLSLNHTGTSPREWLLRIDSTGLYVKDVTLGQDILFLPGGKNSLAIKDGITAPAVEAGWGQLFIDTADGDLKIIFGDGTTKTIVVDT